jgi:diaminopimelate epimerase
VRFSKWHALGNDYLLLERADAGGPLSSDVVRRLCDVHTGVGADGLLEVVGIDGPVGEIVIWNPDGSEAELSGNGTRIAARWLAGRSRADEVEIVVGGRRVAARLRGGGVLETVMGRVEVHPAELLEVGHERIEVIPVVVGNPHAVIRWRPTRSELLRLGPLVERHPRFPSRTNVQLVAVEGAHDVTAAVWERGAGETRASGTSACAVAGAAVANGWCDSPVTVHMPGGELDVTLDSQLGAVLVGPAQEICRGELSDELRAELGLG